MLLVASKFRSIEVFTAEKHPSRRASSVGPLGLGSFFTNHQSSVGADKVVHPGGSKDPNFNMSTELLTTRTGKDEKLYEIVISCWSQESDSKIFILSSFCNFFCRIQYVSLFGRVYHIASYVARFGEPKDLKWSPPAPEHGIEKTEWMKPCKGLPSWCHGAVVADGVG